MNINFVYFKILHVSGLIYTGQIHVHCFVKYINLVYFMELYMKPGR